MNSTIAWSADSLAQWDAAFVRNHQQRRLDAMAHARQCLERIGLPELPSGSLKSLFEDLTAERTMSFRNHLMALLPSLSPEARRQSIDLVLALQDEQLARWIAAQEIAWKSTADRHHISGRIKQLQRDHCSDGRWMPPWPDGRRPVGIRWEGPFMAPSGYAWAARNYVLAAEAAGFPVQASHLVFDREYFEKLLPADHLAWKRRHHQPIDPDVYICTSIPVNSAGVNHYQRMRRRNPGFSRYIGYTTFESRRIPKPWIEGLKCMDEIWVPSTFNLKAFQEALGNTLPVRALPHGINSRLYQSSAPASQTSEKPFVFLSVFEFSTRKGWDALIRAWCRAFSSADRVQLLLHVHHPQPSKPEACIRDLVRQTAGLPERVAPIQISRNCLTDAELRALYPSANAFVLPTRGEGWGIPLMEAMAAGLPAISCAEGGQTEFMTRQNSWLVPGRWVPIPENALHAWRMDTRLFHGLDWFEPDIDDLASALREVFEGGPTVREKSLLGQMEISNRFSMEETAKRVQSLLGTPLPRKTSPEASVAFQ